jgi:uncharacterized membrane protein YgcG
MAAAATARKAPATAPRRPPPRRRPRRAQAGRLIPHKTGRASASPAARPRILAGAALVPQAAVRSAGAVRDISDSGLIVRLTRGRSWIAVLCALLGGIVALNVISLSLTAGSGRLSLQIDDLKTQISGLRAQIDERLSASRVEAEAARLGLANPDPKAISYLSARDGDAERLAHLLATDSFLLTPSQPSSYPTGGASYAPVDVSSTPSTTSSSSSSASTTVAPTTSSGTASGTSTSSGSYSGSGTSSGSSTGSTGGVGL